MSSAAARQRLRRERARQGVRVLSVPVDFVAWSEALISSERFLDAWDCDDQEKVEAATAEVIRLLILLSDNGQFGEILSRVTVDDSAVC